jgi:hypothetical protein
MTQLGEAVFLEPPQYKKSIKSWAESGANWFKSAEVSKPN